MEKTVDEHIGVIEDLKSTISVCMPEPEKTEICASLSEAISTMHKYQKIEQIVNEYNLQLGDNTSDGAYNFQRIKELIEGEER